MGPPLVGALREAVQEAAGISRSQLGLWIFLVGLAGSVIGLALAVVLRSTDRVTFARAGTALLAVACFLFAAVKPAPGLALVPVALGWWTLAVARPMALASNGMFADLWESSPHTGMIILHAANSVGKLGAPLVVLLLGTTLRWTGLIYGVAFGLLALYSIAWPGASVEYLQRAERRRDGRRAPGLPRDPLLWLCVIQFGFIAGAEGGATAILGSFAAELRPVPVDWVPAARWPAVAIMVMLAGIVAGRVVFALISVNLSPRRIIATCLFCGLFAVPAVLLEPAWLYLPALFATGICFSATWPAFFGLCAHAFPAERTFLSFAGAFFTWLGINAGIYLSSAVGQVDYRLPAAFLVSVALMLPFVLFLFVSSAGRGLRVVSNA